MRRNFNRRHAGLDPAFMRAASGRYLAGTNLRLHARPRANAPYPSAFLSNSFTTPGFALPAIAFIVCPTKKPNSLSLPPR